MLPVVLRGERGYLFVSGILLTAWYFLLLWGWGMAGAGLFMVWMNFGDMYYIMSQGIGEHEMYVYIHFCVYGLCQGMRV